MREESDLGLFGLRCLPAVTHIWGFWKSDLNSPTLTPIRSSPSKGTDMYTGGKKGHPPQTHHTLKSPQGRLRGAWVSWVG